MATHTQVIGESSMRLLNAAIFAICCTLPVWAQSDHLAPLFPQATQSKSVAHSRTHRVVIQVTQNDAAVMNLALNNAENLSKFYKDKGEKIEIEFVAYGAGLNMVRSDTSPVKERLAMLSGKNMTFTGCGNTLTNQSKMENKEITLVPEARIVPAGIARVVELEEQGWTYVRP